VSNQPLILRPLRVFFAVPQNLFSSLNFLVDIALKYFLKVRRLVSCLFTNNGKELAGRYKAGKMRPRSNIYNVSLWKRNVQGFLSA
jgi:hypothetical protein